MKHLFSGEIPAVLLLALMVATSCRGAGEPDTAVLRDPDRVVHLDAQPGEVLLDCLGDARRESDIPGSTDASCVPDCATRQCGPDGCRGNCGVCPDQGKCFEGRCVECLYSGHCDAGELCEDHACLNSDEAPACEICEDPYPACVVISGTWACVQCDDDSLCEAPLLCEPTLFSCMPPKLSCSQGVNCQSSEDCAGLSTVYELACDPGSRCCFDLKGGCDEVLAFCPGGVCVGTFPSPLPPGMCLCDSPERWADVRQHGADAVTSEACPAGAVCLAVVELMEVLSLPEEGLPDLRGSVCVALDQLPIP